MKNKYYTVLLIIFDIIYYTIIKYSAFLTRKGFDIYFWLFGNTTIDIYENIIKTTTPVFIILGLILLQHFPRLGFAFLAFIPINAAIMILYSILQYCANFY